MKKPSLMERPRAKKAPRDDIVLGVAWYTEEQWARVKESAADPELLENTYADWVKMAEDALKDVRHAVRDPIKVMVDASELAAWCLVHGKPNVSSTRAEFATHKLREWDAAL